MLRRLFRSASKTDYLAALATRPERRDDFRRALVSQGIVLLTSVPDAKGNVTFLDYTDQGQHVFPIFSSEDCAVEFVRTLSLETPTVYQRLNVTVAFLLENDWSRRHLVLNPRSASATEITSDDLQALRRLVRQGGG